MTTPTPETTPIKTATFMPPGPERVLWFKQGTVINEINLGAHKIPVTPPYYVRETAWHFLGVVENPDKERGTLMPVIKQMVPINVVQVTIVNDIESWTLDGAGLVRTQKFDSMLEAQNFIVKTLEDHSDIEGLTNTSFSVLCGIEAQLS